MNGEQIQDLKIVKYKNSIHNVQFSMHSGANFSELEKLSIDS